VVVFLDSFELTLLVSDSRCEDSKRCKDAGDVTRTSECFEGVVASDGARPGVDKARNVSANKRRRGSQNWHGLSGLQPSRNAPASPLNKPVAIVASSCVRPCVERPRRETVSVHSRGASTL
jgi:hypothetical protein